jgi:DnaJ-class molecular chaperone
MSKVNDWSIELKEMVTTVPCHVCDGDGVLEVDVPKPHGFGRDSGYLDTREEACDMCGGSGELQLEDESC